MMSAIHWPAALHRIAKAIAVPTREQPPCSVALDFFQRGLSLFDRETYPSKIKTDGSHIDSERGLEWRCADSLSLREFLRLGERERVPDHSWLSRTRSRLSLEVHDQVFGWVLKRLAEHGPDQRRADRRRCFND